jgi:hypothetical protein
MPAKVHCEIVMTEPVNGRTLAALVWPKSQLATSALPVSAAPASGHVPITFLSELANAQKSKMAPISKMKSGESDLVNSTQKS